MAYGMKKGKGSKGCATCPKSGPKKTLAKKNPKLKTMKRRKMM